VPEDFAPRDDGWKDEPDENDFETLADLLKDGLSPEAVEKFEAMRVKYEVVSMEELVLTAMLILLFIEERESNGEMLGWFSYIQKNESKRMLGRDKAVAKITTLEKMMREARGED